jgi:hypothetical protein
MPGMTAVAALPPMLQSLLLCALAGTVVQRRITVLGVNVSGKILGTTCHFKQDLQV